MKWSAWNICRCYTNAIDYSFTLMNIHCNYDFLNKKHSTLVLEYVTCRVIGLGIWCRSCVSAVFLRGWSHCLCPLLNVHSSSAGLQSVCYFCGEPLKHRKWNSFVCKTRGIYLPWEHPKGVLPGSGRKRSPIWTFQWKSILVVRWWWQVGVGRSTVSPKRPMKLA